MEPRRIATPGADKSFLGKPVFSRDGTFMLDWEREILFSLAIETGEARIVSKVAVLPFPEFCGPPASRWWPARFPVVAEPRWCEEGSEGEVLFLEGSPYRGMGDRLAAVNVKTGACRTLIDESILGEDTVRGYQVVPGEDRLYVSRGRGLVEIDVLTKCEIRVLGFVNGAPSALKLSPDNRLLLVERYVDYEHTSGLERDVGCWLVDRATLEIVDDIPWGQSFCWATSGERVAFLRWAEQLWTYDVTSRRFQRLAYMEPRKDAPDWSRNRYFSEPAWSFDDRMMACMLGRYGSDEGEYELFVIIADLGEEEVRVIREDWRHLAWSPVRRPFVISE